MSDSQFPALSLDNNPWMKYFSPGGSAEASELALKSRAPGGHVIVVQPPSAASQTLVPPVLRTQSGKLMRHTSAPNRLNQPPAPPPPIAATTSDRNSGGGSDSRRGKAEAPAADSAAPAPSQPRLQKKPSNPLLQKQKMFASKSMNTQSAPNLTASMRELALQQDAASRSIESELSQQSLYKTELCRSYDETGSCRYGSKCQFAHGKPELRPVIRHPKYKTEVCKTWQAHGSCPYGTRCRFIHGDESSMPPPPPPAAAGIVAPTPVPAAASSPVPITDPMRTPVSPSSSSSPGPRLAIFADIIGESSAQ